MLAEAMLDVYEANAKRFGGTAPQCVYSARDVTRWCRRVRGALDEATAVYSWDALLSGLSLDGGLIRLWAHEGLRLFADRLPRQEDREWVADHIDEVARSRFPRDALDGDDALRRPLLFSRWLSRSYAPSHRSDLKSFMSSRLRVFYEEERSSSSTMPLVVFDDVVDQVLRIDGVLRSESGHLLLIGESGCGKSMLVRFVAWMLGLDVVEVRATKSYTLAKFDEELKNVMRRAGVDAERICLLIDEADAVSSAFLERMNALLASGEVPGLWSNEEMTKLLAACREQRSALSVATSDDEDDAMIIEWFTNRVRCNLHAVFTLNPGPGGGQALLGDRATASPALFNRCVTLWFGSWSPKALAQVADALIRDVDFGGMGAQELWEERFLSVAEDKFFVVDDEVAEEDYDEYDDEKNQAASKTADKLRRAVVAALVGAHRYCSEHVEATARDFVELVTKWQSTCEAKSGVEAVAQKRRTVGLRELAAAQASVATMQREEQEALARLEEQDAIAKSRLDRMLADQSEAEAKQRDGEALSAELERHGAEIDRRKMEAETSLAKAEPALLAARTAVKGIQKKQLNEVRALRTPPLAVQRTLEVVGILLGNLTPTSSYTAAPWDEVRKVTTRADFIATIVAFEPHQLSDKLATYVLDRFLKPSDTTLKELTRAARQEDPDAKPIEPLEIGSVYKASKACGPLLEWAASQIEYAEIERRVEPLKKEVAELEKEDAATRLRVNELNEELIRLSTSVAAYKEEYAVAIRSAEQIKASMASGKQKADRADRLLGSLKSEQDRWDAEARDFPERVARLPADALRTASVVAYAGKLAELDRRNLASRIEELLEDLGLMSGKSAAHDDEFGNGERTFSTAAYAIEAETIREWHDSFGLPRDERHVENAAIFSSASRFALLVDPSGSATRFVETMLAATQSVTPIDAADPNFTKTLATAARFGSAVVVRGVDDYWDSVAHPLLEHYTASGNSSRRRRTSSVRLGTELVDVSPDFVLVLQARDSQSVRSLPLGLLGRVVVLDFSTTHESLESTVLSRLLRIERPDLERQRLEAVRDIDEQRVRLTKLEDDVLKHISSTEDRQGGTSILDDDAAVRALEQTTTEALSLREETLKSRAALAELGVATLKYAPLAACFARAYYVLARLRSVHFSYEFSLSYFLDNVLTPALRRLSSAKTTRKGDESNESLFERVSQPFLLEYSSRVARSLIRHEHRLAAALALSRIVLETRGDGDCTNVGAHIDLALRIGDLEDEFDHETDDAAARCASALSTGERAVSAGALRKLAQGSEFFRNRLETSGDISTFEDSEDTNVLSAARKAALARATAPEDVASFVASAVRGVLGEECSRAWLSSDSSPVHSAIEDAATHAQEREAAQQRKRRQNKRRAEPNGGDSVQTSPLDALVLESELEAAYAPTIVVLAEVGRDGSRDVEAVASGSAEQQLEAIAMGSQESHSRAEAAMRRCAEKGKWLLLKNAHLADREWLEAFERKLRSIAASAARGGGFCVFLAAEANPGKPLPKHLLARSHKVALGAEVGLRHALKRHADLAVDRWTRPPAERTRVYALFGWAHAVAMERVRYSGRGWSKPYEWSDVDALCALAAADVVFEKCGGAHVAPEDLQWDALAGSFVATYGSRLENDRDFKALEALADRVLSPSAFETRYAPVGVDDAHPWPDGSHFSQGAWHQWIVDLPTENPCKWLGLAPEAELNRSSQALHDLSKAHATLFHDEYLEDSADAANAKTKTKRLDDEGIADLDALRSLCKDDAASLTARELNRQAHLEMCSTPPTKRRTAALARALADGVVRLGALGNARRLLTAAQLDAARHLQVSVDELQLCCDEAAISDAPGMFRVDGLVVRGASWKDGVLSLETGKLDQSGGVKLPELSLCWRQRAPEDEHGKQIKVPLQVADDHILHSQLIVPTSPDDCSTFYLRNVVLEALP